MAVWSEVKVRELFGVARLDAEYYRPDYRENEALLRSLPNVTSLGAIERTMVKGIFDIRAEEYCEAGVPFIRIGNLRNCLVETHNAAHISTARHAQEHKTALQQYDLILSKTAYAAASLVQIAACNCSQDTIALRTTRSSEFNVYLAVFLNTHFGLLQMTRLFQGNIQSHLSLNETRSILVPEPDAATLTAVNEVFEEMMRLRAKSSGLYVDAEMLLLDALGLDLPDLAQEVAYERNFREVARAGRFDAQYFHPEKLRVLEQLAAVEGASIADHFATIDSTLAPPEKETGEQVQNYDLTDALRFFLDDIPTTPTVELGSHKTRFQKGDIVVSRLRSYLREIAIVETEGNCVGSTEFVVLRRREDGEVSAELLLVYLRSEPVQRILKWCQGGSQHPRFRDGELVSIRLPNRVLAAQKEIILLVRASLDAHRESKRNLDEAKARVEAMILGGLGAEQAPVIQPARLRKE